MIQHTSPKPLIPVLAFAALTGCHAHVNLDAPSANAPPSHRQQAYDELHATSMHETHITYLRGGVPVGAERRTDYRQLARGERVHHPEDLRPVVRESSPTSAAIDDYDSSGNIMLGLGIAGGVTVGIGGAVTAATLASASLEDGIPAGAWAGIGIGAVGALALAALPFLGQTRSDEKATAFETLRDRLGLCVAGGDGEIAACETLDELREKKELPERKKKRRKKRRREEPSDEPTEPIAPDDGEPTPAGDDSLRAGP